jgi:hypothetical protein
MGGWLSAKYDDLKTATAVTTYSEDVQNIGHYYRLYGQDAPTATFLFVCKVDNFEGRPVKYFLKSTNMPHTKDIYLSKLTPYCVKKTETEGPAQIDARGYGAILPYMYTGGTQTIQWENTDKTYMQIETDIDAQIAAAKQGLDDTKLPKPSIKNLAGLRGVTRYYQDAAIWGSEVIELFKQLGIVTWEVATNPNFAGHENLVENEAEFRQFLEGVQNQFEEQIQNERVRIIGVFLSDAEPAVYESPFFFHKDVPAMSDIDSIVTVSGRYNLDDEFTTEHMINNEDSQYVRYTRENGEKQYFEWTYQGGQATNYKSRRLEADEVRQIIFSPDFTHTYGHSRVARDYADTINTIAEHPLHCNSIEQHAAGVYLSISGMRVSLKPLDVPGMPKVANTMDHSTMRQHTNIISKRARDWVHLQDWKDKSILRPTNKPNANPIVFAILAMLTLQKKAFKDLKKNEARTEDMFINTLSSANTAVAQKTAEASVEGRGYESRFGRYMEQTFPDMEHTLGDGAIKRDILQCSQDSQGNQAIDSLHCHEESALWIGVQVKSGKRDKEGDFVDFINTFKTLRIKAIETGSRCFGILVHYNGLKQDKAFELIADEPGLSLVSRKDRESLDEFEQRIATHIRKIRQFY